jgi:hypothetical protein
MRKGAIRLLVSGLLLLWSSSLIQVQVAVTQDCSVQILSVSLNRLSLSIGETLQVNVSYDLLYDIQDPLATGIVTVSINAAGEEQAILTRQYGELGANVKKTASVDVMPLDWEPNEQGQMGLVRVSGWVQDSYGSMTDYAERDFKIVRSEARLTLEDVPSQLTLHDRFLLTAHITNVHNSAMVLDNHPVRIEASDTQRIVQTWNLNTSTDGTAHQAVDTNSLGTGTFICSVTSEPSGDYLNTSVQFSFEILKPSLLVVATLNATAYLAFYPGMSNCTALLTVGLACSSNEHDVSEANVTWALASRQGALKYSGAQQFVGQISMPSEAGCHNISVHASLGNHNDAETALSVNVEPREPTLSFTANRTQAAYGDLIQLSFLALDKDCSKPIGGKQVSIYALVESDWILLTSTTLDDQGELIITWQAEDVGNQSEFVFRAVLYGAPEFRQFETSVNVENTRNVHFLLPSRIAVIRGRAANCTIRLTTLDSTPMPGLAVQLVELDTGQTWCSTTTNTSGYAVLGWEIPSEYELGEHRFLIVAEGMTEIEGSITLFLVTYDATVLKLA